MIPRGHPGVTKLTEKKHPGRPPSTCLVGRNSLSRARVGGSEVRPVTGVDILKPRVFILTRVLPYYKALKEDSKDIYIMLLRALLVEHDKLEGGLTGWW